MKVLSYLFLFVALLSSCSSQKSVSTSESFPPSPTWVQSRPITNSYYVGIGVAQKTQGTDFRSAAKENALSDLASEIKVNVN
ncbi:MAG: LPP20 family lipoprotein, partial [Cryomorphaceae bacterium]